MGPEVGPASQRRSRDTLPFLLGVRLAETAFGTVLCPAISCFRAAIRTTVRARSGRAKATEDYIFLNAWRVVGGNGIPRARAHRWCDREQVGHIRCWGDPGGGGGCALDVARTHKATAARRTVAGGRHWTGVTDFTPPHRMGERNHTVARCVAVTPRGKREHTLHPFHACQTFPAGLNDPGCCGTLRHPEIAVAALK
eukprot:gene22685-biopygen1195